MHRFYARDTLALAHIGSTETVAGSRSGCRGEFIREDGVGGLPARVWLCLVIILGVVFLAGCGGEEPAPVPPATTAPAPTTPAAPPAGGTTVGAGQAETIRDRPITLQMDQPVPPDFKAAYQRRSLITVQFYKTGQNPFYPQGLGVDTEVNSFVEQLRAEYPTVQFFSYDIANPGATEGAAELQNGEYGTLAAQLGVGLTPFLATLAPASEGDDYIIKNLFQGYVTQPVVSQALFDLSAVQVEDNTSDVGVTLDQLELTQSGGGIEYVTVRNSSENIVNLQGFTLRTLDPETGQVNPESATVEINDAVEIEPRKSASVGRSPEIVDADGKTVAGTFEGGEGLGLAPGDQVVLLDAGGAVAATITV